ncbi:MAG: protein-disulfide reductase DsbD family protein [Steroidobacterales bacterium]
MSAAFAAGIAHAAADKPEINVKARLVSEVRTVSPGASFWVALEFDIREGWHTYWRNPGDSGKATTLSWKLPAGFSAGPIVWTTPHRFELPPLVNLGYSHHAMHLVRIDAPKDLPQGTTVSLRATANWLVCADVCIPESADVRLDLPATAGAAAIDNATAAKFATARAQTPVPAPAPASARNQGGNLILALGKDWGQHITRIQSLEFFPYDDGIIEYAAPQAMARTADGLELTVKAGDQASSANGPVRGLLVATEQDGSAHAELPMEISVSVAGSAAGPAGGAGAAGAIRNASGTGAAPAAAHSLGVLLLLAIGGGLILNLMPCVFPVLSIKAIGLVEQARKHRSAVRAKGLVFAAGVIVSMLMLAAVLLALRAGGEHIGWGFQLQSPLFVTLMVYLLLAVGLNLSGVYEIGGGLAGIGDGLTQGDSYRASFFTGVLTTLVATPCTAPFMAAAVGAALTQSAGIALGIFAALGLGLALPYLFLSFAPWLRSALPKPGPWMDTLKQVFAFPMYASAAWLLWVLAQQTAAGLAAAFAGIVLVALAAWAFQKSKSGSRHGQRIALATAVLAALVAVELPVEAARTSVPDVHGNVRAQPGGEDWQSYDAAVVAELAAAGKPVLVNFTASWCLTCLFNERNAFHDASVQALFRGKGVTLMKGDWTNRDPAITAALASFGRAGVPLYVVYNARPGSADPVVLPQLLSAGIVRDALVSLPDRKPN